MMQASSSGVLPVLNCVCIGGRMTCGLCGRENPEEAKFCYACGRPLGVEGAQTTAPPPAVPPIVPTVGPQAASTIAWVGIATVIVLAGFVSFRLPGGDASNPGAYQIGRWIGMLLLPCLIAYAIAGRQKVRNWNRFAVWFCALTVLWVGVTYVGQHPRETAGQRMSRLAREALGAQPMRPSTGTDAQVDSAIRNMFRQVVQLNREYLKKADTLDRSELDHLYAADSYIDSERIERMITQLEAVLVLDAEQEENLKKVLVTARSEVQAVYLTESQKQAFLRGFDGAVDRVMVVRKQTVEAERTWIEASEDLYRFALENHSVIQVKGDRILISNDQALTQFNDKLQHAEQARKTFLAKQKEAEAKFAQFQSESGINPADVEALRQAK